MSTTPLASNHNLLAIDPSISATGWAMFGKDLLGYHRLLGAGLSQLPATWRMRTTAERCAGMAEEIARNVMAATGLERTPTVIERPKILNVLKGSKGDPDDILLLAVLVGAIAQRQYASGSPSVVLIIPSEWKGQTPKDLTEERAKARLSNVELDVVRLPAASLQHNVWDAIGIGLWAVGRK